MSNLQKALKAAIEELEKGTHWLNREATDAIKLCKDALSEIEKCEIAAYLCRSKMTDYAISLLSTKIARETEMAKGWSDWHPVEVEKYKFYLNSVGKADWLSDYEFIPLYTSPQPRDWVGLSEVEQKELLAAMYRDDHSFNWLIQATEAKSKELNTKG